MAPNSKNGKTAALKRGSHTERSGGHHRHAVVSFQILKFSCVIRSKTVRLTVRGEPVEPPAIRPEPIDNAFSPEQS
ncbi:MAG: hypothetical protein DID89_2727548378 [Candidatus Nitrotoga sp. CP45]|nr:MAG: hypothetical protein DID89_2727548378 [Candidatus Nitrotoga sp. CP45]